MKPNTPLEEKYICMECGTEVPTKEEFCPQCGAAMEQFGDANIKLEDEEDEFDLSPEALAKGIGEEKEDGTVSLQDLQKEEDGDDDYEKVAQNNSE
jgi:predicted ATP-dependent serine protease